MQDTNPNFQPFGYAGGLVDNDTGVDIVAGFIGGAAANALTGAATLRALNGFLGNLYNQVVNPCYRGVDSLNINQALASGVLGLVGSSRYGPQPNLLSTGERAGHKAVHQLLNQSVVNQF